MKPSSSSASLTDSLVDQPFSPVSPTPSIPFILGEISVWNEKGSVLFDEKGQVRAGNLNQLLLHLTVPYEMSNDSIAGLPLRPVLILSSLLF